MAKAPKRGLGRGIGALIGSDRPAALNPAADDDAGGRQQIPVAFIAQGDAQPRRNFDENSLDELAASIREKGVLQPLIVRKVGPDAYELIAGERRWRAAQMVGLHHVPVTIQDYSDRDALEVAIIENVQRSDLTPAEEARGYKRLMDEFAHRQEDLAKVVGKSRSHVANLLRLLNLPDSVLKLVDEGALSMGHARALVGQDNAEALAKTIIADGLSVRATEALTQKDDTKQATKAKSSQRKSGKDVDTLALEKSLSAALGSKVTIDSQDGGAGKLVIAYPSLEALDDVLEKLGISL